MIQPQAIRLKCPKCGYSEIGRAKSCTEPFVFKTCPKCKILLKSEGRANPLESSINDMLENIKSIFRPKPI